MLHSLFNSSAVWGGSDGRAAVDVIKAWFVRSQLVCDAPSLGRCLHRLTCTTDFSYIEY